MALTLTTAARNAACNALVDLVDGGTTDPQGKMRLYDDASLTTLIAEISLNNPAFGAAATGSASLDTAGGLSASATTGGTVTVAVLVDRDDTEVVRGTVTESGGGGDFILSDTAVSASDLVQINSGAITIPAS